MNSGSTEIVSLCSQHQRIAADAHRVSVDRILKARHAIDSHVKVTPLVESTSLSNGERRVFCKLEQDQVTGSFKPRGSLWRLIELEPEQRAAGVIASTAGNHGVGLSYAGQVLGIEVDIYLPRNADPAKLAKIKANGATVTYFESVEEAREAALVVARETGKTFVSAYNDPFMAEGGGTAGLEILDQIDHIDTLIIPLGGGGFATGVSMAVREKFPDVKIYLVQSAKSPKMARWLERGREHDVSLLPSIAEGLTVNMEAGTITFPYLQRLVDGVILVSEEDIARAIVWAKDAHGWWVEASGASALAALQHLPRDAASGNIVPILTGGNMSEARFNEILSQYGASGD